MRTSSQKVENLEQVLEQLPRFRDASLPLGERFSRAIAYLEHRATEPEVSRVVADGLFELTRRGAGVIEEIDLCFEFASAKSSTASLDIIDELRSFKSSRVRDSLLSVGLTHSSWRVRAASAEELRRYDEPAVSAALCELERDDKSNEVRISARYALRQHSKETLTAIGADAMIAKAEFRDEIIATVRELENGPAPRKSLLKKMLPFLDQKLESAGRPVYWREVREALGERIASMAHELVPELVETGELVAIFVHDDYGTARVAKIGTAPARVDDELGDDSWLL